MKFCFELHHLSIGDAVTIERLHVATEYTVDEFAAMMAPIRRSLTLSQRCHRRSQKRRALSL